MFWADKIASDIGKSIHHVDDMKTLSGYAHMGSIRGPILHDVVYKALKAKNKKTTQTYVFNDFDVIDGLSVELKPKFSKYMGFPLRLVPSPDGKARSFADYFANDFKKVLLALGFDAEFLSSFDMYKEGKFNEAIKEALEHAKQIQNIYQEVSGSKKKEQGWYPFQVICPQCSKLGTTKVVAWNGKQVSFICEKDLVTWAEGCGYEGNISPFDGNGKLPWKVDWPAHWKVMGVTLEGAGKDHASRGGSYDIAFALCEKVFHYPKPYYFPYEHFLIGGRKMSSSKGIGLKARDITSILPPSVARFLFVRTNPKSAIEFSPDGMQIPDLFDEFDRFAKEYVDNPKSDEARIFELSCLDEGFKSNCFIPRFRDIANSLQLQTVIPSDYFTKQKRKALTTVEKNILNERIRYAKIWLEKYAPDEFKFTVSQRIPKEVNRLTQKQKDYLARLAECNYFDADQLQQELYERAKKMQLSGKDAFEAIYISLLGKNHGPKAAWFINSLDSTFVKKRFKESSEQVASLYDMDEITKTTNYQTGLESTAVIQDEVQKKFSGISCTVAIIKGVTITKKSIDLEKYKKEVLSKYEELTTEHISQMPTIQAYRKLFKGFGVDWHSHRPSPEALLRRIALNKGLYNVNTLVDAYNIAVIQTAIGLGAFDLSRISFPVSLRFAKKGETIHLLGDQEETELFEGELVYSDAKRIVTMDLNYRDADYTKVTESTKDIILFADGAPGITHNSVMDGLKKGIELIIRYCGGKVSNTALIE